MITVQRIPWSRIEYSEKYEEVNFEQINSEYINKLITTTAQIAQVHKPEIQTEKVEYFCNACKSLLSFDKILTKSEMRKQHCDSCGRTDGVSVGRTKYKDVQLLTITTPDTKKQLTIFLEDQLVSHDKYQLYDTIQIKGVVRAVEKTEIKNHLIIQCRDVTVISRMEETEAIEKPLNRNSPEYTKWVNEIQNRDKVCQICGGNKHLEAHHIYSYKNNPSLRTDMGNGVLLCTFCHNKFHSYYGKDVTPADLVNFIYQFKGR